MTKLFTNGGSPVELPSGAEQVHLLGFVNYTTAGQWPCVGMVRPGQTGSTDFTTFLETLMRHRTLKNNGWGRSLQYAAIQALLDFYMVGHFGTVKELKKRARKFVRFLRAQGVRDFMEPEVKAHAQAYAAHVRGCMELGLWSLRYAVGLISAVNVLMRAVRGDDKVWISPANALGRRRSQIRTEIPDGMDEAQLEAALAAMRQAGFKRPAAVLELTSTFGLRVREASLADLVEWRRQALEEDRINVQKGTKGGRKAERFIQMDDHKRAVLERALACRPKGSRNLVAPDETAQEFMSGELGGARGLLKAHDIANYRETRAAYACRRYKEITGFDAPILTGGVIASDEVDLAARKAISHELGHDRIDVVAAYIGGRKRGRT